MSKPRSYGHFCVLAMALERVGDRWTLLVIRDLLGGPQRFTDLAERLAGITPKTLSQRLRELEDDGLVEADRVAGRREVWYQLTPAGKELQPILEELLVWGLQHSARPCEPGEPAHPEHLLLALRVTLQRAHLQIGPVNWVIDLVDDGTYTLGNEDGTWTVAPGRTGDPDVVVSTTRDAFARYLTTPAPLRPAEPPDTTFAGTRSALRTFIKAIGVFPPGRPQTT